MSTTATQLKTVQSSLDKGNINELGDAARAIQLGTMLTMLKVTFAGLTAATVIDITSAASFSKATINKGNNNYSASKLLPPIGVVRTLRVTAGALAAGPAIVTDAGGTPAAIGTGTANVATLSDDGKTLTFQANVTGFVLEYFPLHAVDPSSTDFDKEI